MIRKQLDLRRPIFAATAAYGHFGRNEFPWEKVTKHFMHMRSCSCVAQCAYSARWSPCAWKQISQVWWCARMCCWNSRKENRSILRHILHANLARAVAAVGGPLQTWEMREP